MIQAAARMDVRQKDRAALAPTRHAGGFTLVELLIVMAIVSLLASILLPSLSRAKRLAESTICASNLRQISLAMDYYLENHERAYPCAADPVSTSPFYWLWMGRGFRGLLGPYIDSCVSKNNPSVLLCPGDRTPTDKYESTSYAYSMSFYHSPEQIDGANSSADTYSNPRPSVVQREQDVANPSNKVLIGEWNSLHDPTDGDNGWWCWVGSRNFLLADGSIAYLTATEIREARDLFPDPNLTVGGLSGLDFPR